MFFCIEYVEVEVSRWIPFLNFRWFQSPMEIITMMLTMMVATMNAEMMVPKV